MKKLIFLLTTTILFLVSCNRGGKGISVLKLLPVLSGREYEYIDKDGKIIINPQFAIATVFRNGLALVKSTANDSKTWGFINEDGKFAITPTYREATVFSDDLAWVVSDNSAPIAINKKNEIKITLENAQTVKIFKEGFAAFSILDSNNIEKWGFVDKDGTIKINPQFAATGNFNGGKCAVENSERKWGYIDDNGKIVINYQFDNADQFVNGKAVVETGGKWGLVDGDGKYLINPQFAALINDNDMFLIEQDGKWGWCDKDGKIIINPQFARAYPFLDNDLAPILSGNTFGFIDKDGKIVINPQFDMALPFNGSSALVQSGQKIGFIDNKGRYVVNPQFDGCSQDLYQYMYDGSTNYESVHTNYFNINGITERIKRDITEKSVSGLNYTMPFSTILSKFKINQDIIAKNSYATTLINSEKITNEASLDFEVGGNPWASNYTTNYQYVFDQNYLPLGFGYTIHLKGNGIGKEKDILKSFENAFDGYTKDSVYSNINRVYVKNSYQSIDISYQYGTIRIVIKPIVQQTQSVNQFNSQQTPQPVNQTNSNDINTSTIPTYGLVAWYPFNGNANDATGNNHNGTVTGATLTTNRFGQANSAYLFNGTSDYINIGSFSVQSFTLSAWINISNVNESNLNAIISRLGGTINYEGYELRVEPNSTILLVCGFGSNWVHTNSSFKLLPNTWYNIVATNDNTDIKIYVNAQLVATNRFSNFVDNPQNIILGTRSPIADGGWFNGKLDDIRIYNRALSLSEINSLHSEGE